MQILQQQSAAGGGPTREVLRRLAAGLRGDVFASSRQEDEAAAVPALKAMDLDWTERQVWEGAFNNLEMVRVKQNLVKKEIMVPVCRSRPKSTSSTTSWISTCPTPTP